MAENRKNSYNSNSNNKNYPASRQNGTAQKGGNGKQNEKRSKVAVKEKNSNHKEIVALIIIAVCIFLVVAMFGGAGVVGSFIVSILYGFFGGFGTVIAIIVALVYSVCTLRGNEKSVFRVKRCILLGGMFLCGSALLHTISGIYENYADSGDTGFFKLCASLWGSVNEHFLGGGLIGGALSSLLQATVDTVGTYVILIPATLILAMIIFSFSILPLYKKIEKAAQKGWGGVVTVSNRLKDKSKKKKNGAKVAKGSGHEIVVNDNADYYIDEDTGEIIEINTDNAPDFDDEDDIIIEPQGPVSEGSGFDISIDEGGSYDFTESAENVALETAVETVKTEEIAKQESAENPAPITEETVAAEIAKVKKSPLDSVDMPVLSKGEYADYVYPPDDLLNMDTGAKRSPVAERAAATAVAKKLEEVLRSFSIEAKVTHVSIGPTVTRYELLPSTGVRVNRIKNLSDDIALNLAAQSIRIEAPIPGKAAIGIEIPNKENRAVYLREIIQSAAFKNNKSNLTFCLGSDISGAPIAVDLEKMPHMMIAGTTGSGKSVCTNCIITSLLYKSSPDEVRLILVDPKIVEFAKYNGIPHLLLPVVTEPKKAAAALAWAVSEMEKRYKFFAAYGVRDISSYNSFAEKNELDKMPRIVIIIDELADLMMVARDSVETAINRIAQKARAAGMHLVIATQRPSVDVITGLIKSNVPSRIALKVASPVDSRIILDTVGAEKLLGRGDMLYYPVGSMKTTRIQGAFVSDDEIEKLVEFIKDGGGTSDGYIEEIIQSVNNAASAGDGGIGAAMAMGDDDEDALFKQAVAIAIREKQISASYLQRMLKIGFNRAARMIDLMEEKGIIGCRDGNNPRKVLVDHYDGVNE